MGKVTLKIVQKYEPGADGKRNVRLRITANRIVRFSATEVYVVSSAFNPKGKRESTNWIRSSHPTHDIFNALITLKYDRALAAIKELGEGATADQVKQRIEQGEVANPEQVSAEPIAPPRPTFMEYADTYMKRRGDSGTTDTYYQAVNAFRRFLASRQGVELKSYLRTPEPGLARFDITFEEISIPFLKEWRQWVLDRFKNNTGWLYHSRLKSLYFQAMEDLDGLTALPVVVSDPFRRVKVPMQRTKKKRLYEDEILRLAAVDLPWGSPKRKARDLALMMYYAHGMRVGDALRIRAENYVIIPGFDEEEEHRIIYIMGKRKKAKNVLLPDQCIELLAPYRAACSQPTDTLFPYLRRVIDAGYSEYDIRLKIKSRVAAIRIHLMEVARNVGIDKSLSAHIFRHSFADLARRNGMDIMDIQKALGHEQINTTQGYMEDLDEYSVDKARDLFRTTVG